MALQKQMVPLSYGGGLDTKTDPSSVPLGKWLILENCVFTHPKSLHKRNGFASLTTSILGGGNISAGSLLATRGNELVLGDGANLYSYDQANTAWVNKGALPNATVATLGQIGTQYSLEGYDTALHSGGLQIIVSEQRQDLGSPSLHDLVYSVIDTATGQQVVGPTSLDVAANNPCDPKVCVLGNYFFVVWARTAGSNVLMAQAIAVAAPQTLVYGSAQAVTSGAGTSALNAICMMDMTVSNGVIYIVFANVSGTTTIFGITAVATYTQSYTAVVAGTAPQSLCIVGNQFNNDVVVGITQANTTATAFAYNSTLASQTLAPTTIDTQAAGFGSITAISTSASATAIKFFVGWGQSFADARYVRQNTLGAAYAVGTASTLVRSVRLAGKPILYSGAVYLPAWLTGNGNNLGAIDLSLQATWVLLDSTGLPVAKAYAGTGGGYRANNFNSKLLTHTMLPESPAVGGGKFNFAINNQVRASAEVGGAYIASAQYAVALVQLDLANTSSQYTKTALGDVLLFSGSVPRMYDGGRVVEQGFLYYPDITAISHGAGGLLSAGTYQYVVVYEWQDSAGQLHRSAPSPAASVTVAASDKVTLGISTLRVSAKTNVLINVFRTIANGTLFYQITNCVGGPVLLNDATVDTATFINDSAADANIQAQKQVYTSGDVVAAAAPPPLSDVVTHRNRVFGIDPTTGQLAYTKQFVPGSTGQPIEFSDFLTENLDTRGGDPTALASLDEKLIVFKADRIFMLLGQGPDDTGGSSDFSDAILVSSDTGCAAPKSIVLVPDGIMFKSPKGIYLLDRALRLSYVGAEVETYNSATVTSAQLVSGTNQARFTLNNGKALVYDYYVGQWSVFTNVSAVDATIWGGGYVYLTSAGVVNQETAGAFADPGSVFIAMKAVSAWIQLAQIQGFQRVYRVLVLGDYVSAHTLTVKLAYDFASTFAQIGNVTVSSDLNPYQLRFHCAKQKCEAIQISVEDASLNTIGESLILSGLMLEAGIKRGAFKLPAAQSVG